MSIAVWPGVEIDSVGARIVQLAEHYPDKQYLYVTSSKRNEPGSYHSSALTYNRSATSAVDFGAGGRTADGDSRMRDFAKWLLQFYPYLIEEIHTTPFPDDAGYYVKNQSVADVYGPTTKAAHLDHVHVASSAALMDQLLSKLGPTPLPVAEDFTPEQAVHFEVACWRIAAMISGSKTVVGGPLKGEPNKFSGG